MTTPKLCECGCGEPAPIATGTDATRGYVKGEPRRFINGHQMRVRSGRRNHRYNGEICIRDDGRAVVYGYGRDGSLRFFYRIVMEAHLGRPMTSEEIIHHKNGDPGDDRIENLEILTRAEHMNLHRAELQAAQWGK